MKTFYLCLTYLIAALLLISACSLVTDPESDPGPDPAGQAGEKRGGGGDETPLMVIVDYQVTDLSAGSVQKKLRKADLLILETTYLWSRSQNAGAVDDMKSRNSKLKVLGYINAHTTWLAWGDEADPDNPANSYGYDWYTATSPYWALSTTGEPVQTWPGKVLLNVLKPECRAAMIGVIQDYQTNGINPLDGVFWDNFNHQLWISPAAENGTGSPDFDEDGIGYYDDPDEQAAYSQSQVDLVEELRAAMGDDFIQIFNGTRAATDPAFAALGDGMMYENFPVSPFVDMDQAVAPDHPFNLFTARDWFRSQNGGPYLILTSRWIIPFVDDQGDLIEYHFSEFNRAMALLTDAMVSYHDTEEMVFGWPENKVDLGDAKGPATWEGEDTITREFKNGSVTVTFTYDHESFPMDFEIIGKGNRVLQSFDFPEHTP